MWINNIKLIDDSVIQLGVPNITVEWLGNYNGFSINGRTGSGSVSVDSIIEGDDMIVRAPYGSGVHRFNFSESGYLEMSAPQHEGGGVGSDSYWRIRDSVLIITTGGLQGAAYPINRFTDGNINQMFFSIFIDEANEVATYGMCLKEWNTADKKYHYRYDIMSFYNNETTPYELYKLFKGLYNVNGIAFTLYVDTVEENGKFIPSTFKLTANADFDLSVAERTEIRLFALHTTKDPVSEPLLHPIILNTASTWDLSSDDGSFISFMLSDGSVNFSLSEWKDATSDVLGVVTDIFSKLSDYHYLFVASKTDDTIYNLCYAEITSLPTSPKEGMAIGFGIVNSFDADDKTNLKISFESGDGDDGYSDPDDTDDDDGSGDGDDGFETSGALTTTYGLNLARANALGDFIWNNSLFDNIKNINNAPIENIISCKAFPFNISGTDKQIMLGNVNTGVNGTESSATKTIILGTISIPTKYTGAPYYCAFLDYAPYTTIRLHLPYIGFVELDTNIFMGKTLTVKYIVDLVTGACKALVLSKSRVYAEYNGTMGIDVPITASNRSQIEVGWIEAGLGVATAIAGGAVAESAGAVVNNVSGGVGSVLSAATNQFHYQSSSSGSPNTTSGEGANRKCYVIVDRPMWDNYSEFNHTYGRMCNKPCKISKLKGYTKVDMNMGMADIGGTITEKEELRELLSSGFYI